MATQTVMISDHWKRLEDALKHLKTRGMEGMASNAWPVIIRKGDIYQEGEYRYPITFFNNLQWKYKLHMPYEKKSDRVFILKQLIDQFLIGEVDLHMFHFGVYCVYGHRRSWTSMDEDFTEKSIGKRRADFYAKLPVTRYIDNDEFFAQTWSLLVDRREVNIGEHRCNPTFSQLRILFTPELFGAWSGTYYSNADWLEPIGGDFDLGCKKFLAEKDPMTPSTKKEGMIEGKIYCVPHLQNGNRHFVRDEPVHAGRYMEVRFGDGWIRGRYEWSFNSEDPIQIHAGDQVIYIREGHLVRV
jgi:hypothetical protein